MRTLMFKYKFLNEILTFFFKVNGRNLAGLFHHDVVKCLKELPLDVCIVCARRTSGPSPLRGTIVNNVDPGKSKQAFASRVSFYHLIVIVENGCF